MTHVVEVRPYPVMVSTVPLSTQLARLEDSLPQVRELVEATCPEDPAYLGRLEMLRSSEQVIDWLREALR